MTIRLYNPATHTVVPREPTPEMLNKLFVLPEFVGTVIVRHSVDKLPDAYAAMLVAAPDASRPLPTREEIALAIFYITYKKAAVGTVEAHVAMTLEAADSVLTLLARAEK